MGDVEKRRGERGQINSLREMRDVGTKRERERERERDTM
jgi:hypothetical protein